MFLAVNELKKEKSRFILIIIVIVLVAYSTYFLTGLAYGLAKSYTQGLEKWSAQGIILSENSNNNIARSLITKTQYSSLLDEDSALLGISSTSLNAKKNKDVTIFGLEKGKFTEPNLVEGKKPQDSNEVVVANDLKKIGLNLGDELNLKNIDKKYRIAGFTDEATFQTQPIIYMDLAQWRTAATEISGMSAMRDETTANAIITKKQPVSRERLAENKLSWQKLDDYFFQLPGYKPQVLTFSLMIGFLIIISALVLAIFMYILTLQKRNIFGVLKAEGVPNNYITRSVILQSLIITISGLGLGLGFAILTALGLKDRVPFLVNIYFFTGIFVLFLIFTVLGSLVSVRAISKIDPAEAIK